MQKIIPADQSSKSYQNSRMVSEATIDGIMIGSLAYGVYSALASTIRNLGLIKNFKINNVNAKPLQSITKSISTSIEQNGSSNLMGCKRLQLQYAPFQKLSLNNPTTIDGIKYSGHAIDKMQNTGILPSVVKNTMKRGLVKKGATAKSLQYFDKTNNISVIIDKKSGNVVTTFFGD